MTYAEQREVLRRMLERKATPMPSPYVPPERCNVPATEDCPGCPACRM